jgi:hypothetical protein
MIKQNKLMMMVIVILIKMLRPNIFLPGIMLTLFDSKEAVFGLLFLVRRFETWLNISGFIFFFKYMS